MLLLYIHGYMFSVGSGFSDAFGPTQTVSQGLWGSLGLIMAILTCEILVKLFLGFWNYPRKYLTTSTTKVLSHHHQALNTTHGHTNTSTSSSTKALASDECVWAPKRLQNTDPHFLPYIFFPVHVMVMVIVVWALLHVAIIVYRVAEYRFPSVHANPHTKPLPQSPGTTNWIPPWRSIHQLREREREYCRKGLVRSSVVNRNGNRYK